MSQTERLARLKAGPSAYEPTLAVLATRALEASTHGWPTADLHRNDFIAALERKTGLSENMLAMLRLQRVLP